MSKKIRTLGVLYAKSFSVDLDEVDHGNGVLSRKLAIRHPSAVSVVPMIGSDKAVLVTQHRYALDMTTVEFPAGKIDPGETPEETAVRELWEETGYRAGTWRKLAAISPAPGYSDEIIHVFLAEDLVLTEKRTNEAEIERVETMSLSRIKDMILRGEIVDSTTISSLAAYQWATETIF